MPTLPDGARLEPGRGGLDRLVLATAVAEAHVYLHGAQLTHFQPAAAKPVLWLSDESAFAAGKPIRGGVPVCFPWFGPKPDDPGAPMHGFARLREWSLVSVETRRGVLTAALELRSDDATRRFFPEAFTLRMTVAVGPSLQMTLSVRNDGERPFRYEEALHTYFAVGDARRIRIGGLESARYIDKADARAQRTQGPAELTITGETDRVFNGCRGPITIEDPAWQRRLHVERSGSATAVVWNPWLAKARAMPDFGDEEWTAMVCVESANAGEDALTLEPAAAHELTTTLGVEPG